MLCLQTALLKTPVKKSVSNFCSFWVRFNYWFDIRVVCIFDHYKCSHSGLNLFGIGYVFHWILINQRDSFGLSKYMITYMYQRCKMNFPYIIMFIQIYHHNEKLNLLKSFGCILFEIYRCIASFRCDIVIIWPHTY